MLTEKISGAWLAQFKDGGHALMYQYPERLSAIVNTFLDNYPYFFYQINLIYSFIRGCITNSNYINILLLIDRLIYCFR